MVDIPASIAEASACLRADLSRIHVMHGCDERCPDDCERSDYSEAAYRSHDERNADVREDIEHSAVELLDAVTEWFGTDTRPDGRRRRVCRVEVSLGCRGGAVNAPSPHSVYVVLS